MSSVFLTELRRHRFHRLFAFFKILVPRIVRNSEMDTEMTYRELWLSFPQGVAYHLRSECLVWTAHHSPINRT